MDVNKKIQREGQSATTIFDNRSVESDYPTLLSLLKEGLRVLDIGCGTGAISKGIAKYVGSTGEVIGIDNTESFILSGRESYKNVKNLKLFHSDLFEYKAEEKFDLIVAARVLQWLNHPKSALEKMKEMLLPGGVISILDYNHTELEWSPQPPNSMVEFYKTWLKWREEAGLNNKIAEDLGDYFKELGLHNIEVFNSNEYYKRGESNFKSKVGIWSKVAGSKQLVDEGYITEEDRLKTIEDYDEWVETSAQGMVMKLKEVRGIL